MGVYDFDLESYIGLARRLGTDTERVEVKAASQGLPKSMAETLSAFSNTSGGVVPGFKARAVADALAQMCGEKMEPPVRASVEIVEFEGSPVVVATVPELPPELKPCFVKSRAMHDGSYVRVGDGDRRLSPYEVDRLLEGRRPPRYDREVVEGAAMGDFDEELLEGFMRRQRADSPRAFKGMSDEELLEALCVTARDGDCATHIGGTYGARALSAALFPAGLPFVYGDPGDVEGRCERRGAAFSRFSRDRRAHPRDDIGADGGAATQRARLVEGGGGVSHR